VQLDVSLFAGSIPYTTPPTISRVDWFIVGGLPTATLLRVPIVHRGYYAYGVRGSPLLAATHHFETDPAVTIQTDPLPITCDCHRDARLV